MRSLIKHVPKRDEPPDDLNVAGWVRTRRLEKARRRLAEQRICLD